jgi:hypothetical protein
MDAGLGIGFGILAIAAIFLAVLMVLAIFGFWIWMLIHALTNRGLGDGEKVAWVLVILFLHLLGAIIYICVGYSKARLPPANPSPMG